MDNRFEMIRPLGKGGRSRVFLVRDHARKGIFVALKRPDDSGLRRGKAALEFEYLSRLRHPNLARAYDFGEDDEGVYFTSEFVDGRPVDEWAKTASQTDVVRALGSLLRAISLLHDRNLVHGDISFKNVLVRPAKKNGKEESSSVLKLLDLGEAGRPGRTDAGMTAGFAAPEVLQGRGALFTSDLYAFGALAAFVLLGAEPFGEGGASDIVKRQLEGDIRLPKSALSPVAALCRDLLRPDPAERPQSAAEVLRRLLEASQVKIAFDLASLSAEELPAPRLVQREKESAALLNFIEQLEDDDGCKTAAIEGPRGSGRSAMLEETARFAQLGGIGVIGRARTRADADYLLSSLCRACDETKLSETSKAALLPWMSAGRKKASPVIDLSRIVFAALEALVLASQDEPKLILVDDFSDADKVTREVIFALARALSPGRSARPRAAVLIVSVSDERTTPAEMFPAAASLEPLTGPGVFQLVSSMLPGISVPKEFSDAVFLSSSGFPKAAEELVRQSAGAESFDALTNLVTRKLRLLDEKELLLIAAAGAADESIPESVLREMGADEASVSKLVRQGFLLEDGASLAPAYGAAETAAKASARLLSKDAYAGFAASCASILKAEGLYRAAGALWRSMGDFKSAHDAFFASAAYRLAQGDKLGAAERFEVAIGLWDKHFDISKTAEQAVDTWRTVGWFEQAARAVPLLNLCAEDARMLDAELAMEQGRHREALSLLTDLQGAPSRPLKFASVKAACEMQLGRHEQALSTASKALQKADRKNPAIELAQLAQIGGLSCTYLGRTERAAALFKEAEKMFEALNDAPGRIKVLGNMGLLYRQKGDSAEARRLYDKAVLGAESLGDRLREGLHRMNRAAVEHSVCNYRDAYDDYCAALEIAEILGNEFRTTQVEINLADLLIDMGQGGRAVKAALQALKRCRAVGQARLETRALLTAGRASFVNGDFIRAETRLLEALRRFSAAGDETGQFFAKLRAAELFSVRGDFDRAVMLAREVLEDALKKNRFRENARARLITARAALEKNEALEDALAQLECAEDALKREPSPDTLMQVALLRARVSEKLGRPEARRTAVDFARSLFRTIFDKVPDAFKTGFLEHLRAPELSLSSSENAEPSDRWVRDLEMLMEINRELTSERDPSRLLRLIMESAVNLTGAERGMLVMPKADALAPVIVYQISDEAEKSFSRSVAEKVVREGRSVLAVDALGDERFRAFVSVNALKLRSILAVPLQIKRRTVGAIYLDSRLQTGVFSDADRRLLEAFGAQAAVCLETARLMAENRERCRELHRANEEITALSDKLADKLQKKEAKLVRVGALLEKTQESSSKKLKKDGLVGSSAVMQKVRKLIVRIAPSNVPVYIFGASGTGKELAARAIHAESERRNKPFVAVNCGALPPKLLAGELFGHKKGAFTGAVSNRPGLFKVADKGTLFLDEVADMDKEMQTHLLRVLQDGTFRSLGDNEEISVDVRILAASNRDLEEEVKSGRFREDLFYRLNVVRIDLPPLSERREDIPLLIEALGKRHGKEQPPKFTRIATDLLTAADWPGNVRELENEVLRAMTMAGDRNAISPEDLSPRFSADVRSRAWSRLGTLKEQVAVFEEMTIRRKTAECGGNASKAARALGISRATLYKKLGKTEGGRA